MIHTGYKNCFFWKCAFKPSEHACKILFNYSKLCLSVFSQRKYNFYHQNTLLDVFGTNSGNIIGRNPSMVIPLLANQDMTPMLLSSQSCSRKLATAFSVTFFLFRNDSWSIGQNAPPSPSHRRVSRLITVKRFASF